MNVLVINAGSSSLKFQLLDVDTREVYAKGNCERIGIEGSFVGYESIAVKGKQKIEAPLPDHKTAMQYVIDIINATGKDFIGIGHRVVQGGWYFPESKVVTDESLGWVREVAPLAPLHNYAEADAIEVCRELFPDKGNVVVADTSFHYAIPERAHRYALPRDVVDKLHIRKYGAHGTSHRYIWRKTKELLGDDVHKLVSCHLGSGASLSAIEDGHDMDTTMGLTPLDGLIMGTRCGTIDPAVLFFLGKNGYTLEQMDKLLNKESGFQGLTGAFGGDTRDVVAKADAGDMDAIEALEAFGHRAALYVGGYNTLVGGADAIVMAGGIGENAAELRAQIVKRLGALGVKLDKKANKTIRGGKSGVISTKDSKIPVIVIPTNEELMIARETVATLKG